MQEAGITGKLYRAVQSLYENRTSAVLTAIMALVLLNGSPSSLVHAKAQFYPLFFSH
jgi:hypothetical protein